MKQILFVQIFFCVLMISLCLCLALRLKARDLPAGNFGKAFIGQETFEDFALSLYGDLYYG